MAGHQPRTCNQPYPLYMVQVMITPHLSADLGATPYTLLLTPLPSKISLKVEEDDEERPITAHTKPNRPLLSTSHLLGPLRRSGTVVGAGLSSAETYKGGGAVHFYSFRWGRSFRCLDLVFGRGLPGPLATSGTLEPAMLVYFLPWCCVQSI